MLILAFYDGLPNAATFPLQGSMTSVADDSEEHLQQISVMDVDVVLKGLLVVTLEQWKNPGCLGYVGDYTTQLEIIRNLCIRIPIKQPV